MMSNLIHRVVGSTLARAGLEVRRRKKSSRLSFTKIPGWFSIEEAEFLYQLAFMVTGRALEIGHFLGRSTSAVCEAIRDSGRPVEFNSYDIGFSSPDEFVAYYRTIYRDGSLTVPSELEEMVFAKKMSTTELACQHLEALDLASYVRLVSGDFSALDATQYDFIFCDAMHDPTEIARNLPAVVRVSRDICTWAFHDMTDGNLAAVQHALPVRLIARVDTLGVFQFIRANDVGKVECVSRSTLQTIRA